jgi:hypothetical protein
MSSDSEQEKFIAEQITNRKFEKETDRTSFNALPLSDRLTIAKIDNLFEKQYAMVVDIDRAIKNPNIYNVNEYKEPFIKLIRNFKELRKVPTTSVEGEEKYYPTLYPSWKWSEYVMNPLSNNFKDNLTNNLFFQAHNTFKLWDQSEQERYENKNNREYFPNMSSVAKSQSGRFPFNNIEDKGLGIIPLGKTEKNKKLSRDLLAALDNIDSTKEELPVNKGGVRRTCRKRTRLKKKSRKLKRQRRRKAQIPYLLSHNSSAHFL